MNVGRCKVRGDQSGRRKGVAGLYPLSCRDATTGVHSEDVTGTSWILNSSDKQKIPDPTSEQSARAAPPPPSRRRRLTPPPPSPPFAPLPSVRPDVGQPLSPGAALCAPDTRQSLYQRARPLSSRSLPARCRGKGETKRRASSCTQTNPVTELLIAGNYGEDT